MTAGLPPWRVAPSSETLATADLEGAQSMAGRVALQSYRDGNWEIYFANDLLSGANRITNHPAIDAEPHLSPDVSRISFSSTLAGNYDVYTVGVDGSGLRQFTSDPAIARGGNWSPDGKRLVFQSRRSGNSDVWVMNADGTSQTALTTNPDYFLFTMNADGSNPHVVAHRPLQPLRRR